jgi:hypothetical protein
MAQHVLSMLSATAIAVLVSLPAIAAPPISRPTSRPIPSPADRTPVEKPLEMVMVDQAQLSSAQRSTFQRYLQTANLPNTKIGNRCQYYGKPDVWCLILDPPLANQVYQQLKQQADFRSGLDIKPVRRLRSPERI